MMALISFGLSIPALNIADVLTGSVALGMLKVQKYVRSAKILHNAKEQSLRYDSLYQMIKREEEEHTPQKQDGPDFVAWINREFMQIALQDSELSYNTKTGFSEHCKTTGIPFKDDMEMLKTALNDMVSTSVQERSVSSEDKKNHTTALDSMQTPEAVSELAIEIKKLESMRSPTRANR
jgi:hypothetical protein